MKTTTTRFTRAVIWALLLAFLVTSAVAQQQGAPSAPSAQSPEQKGNGTATGETTAKPVQAPESEPEHKITKQEADALFRSVDEILQFASKDTGLPIKHSVKRKLASREEVSKYIEDRMKDDDDTKRLQRSEVVLKKFGLIPQKFDLRSFMADLLKEQVAGFYDTKKKTVFLLDWVEPEAQKPVLAHELTHALQDQNFGLEEWAKKAEASESSKKDKRESAYDLMADERLAARQAVSEGQAMVVLVDYMLAESGQSVKKDPQIANAVMAGMEATGETPLYTKAPMFLKQLLLFPYQRGLRFEAEVLQKTGTAAAFTGAFQNPPEDSRQILEPETYLKKQTISLMPVPDFESAAGKEYEKYDVSVMGEFDVWLLAKQYSEQKNADSLSRAWRGGYYYAATKPEVPKAKKDTDAVPTSSIALAYVSKWASADEAEQFAAIYANYIPKRYKVETKVQDKPLSEVLDDAFPTRLEGVHSWKTDEGDVSIETHGDTMLVMEGFDSIAAGKIEQAVFEPKSESLNQ